MIDWCTVIPRTWLPFLRSVQVSHLIIGERSNNRGHLYFLCQPNLGSDQKASILVPAALRVPSSLSTDLVFKPTPFCVPYVDLVPPSTNWRCADDVFCVSDPSGRKLADGWDVGRREGGRGGDATDSGIVEGYLSDPFRRNVDGVVEYNER